MPPAAPQPHRRALAADSAAAGGPDSAAASDDGDADAAPVLALPQLQTGMSEGEVQALAYLVFAANCANGVDGATDTRCLAQQRSKRCDASLLCSAPLATACAHPVPGQPCCAAELLATVRNQLGVDEARAREVARLLELVRTTFARMKQATGVRGRTHAEPVLAHALLLLVPCLHPVCSLSGAATAAGCLPRPAALLLCRPLLATARKGALPVSNLWTANLELPVCLLGVVLPKDFNRHVLCCTALCCLAFAFASMRGQRKLVSRAAAAAQAVLVSLLQALHIL